jgi:hypothetical protein
MLTTLRKRNAPNDYLQFELADEGEVAFCLQGRNCRSEYCRTSLEMFRRCVCPGDSSLDHTPSEHIDFNDYQSAVNGLANVLLVLQA